MFKSKYGTPIKRRGVGNLNDSLPKDVLDILFSYMYHYKQKQVKGELIWELTNILVDYRIHRTFEGKLHPEVREQIISVMDEWFKPKKKSNKGFGG